MKNMGFLRSVSFVVVASFMFSMVYCPPAVKADNNNILSRESLRADSNKILDEAGDNPGALSAYFDGHSSEVYDAYRNMYGVLKDNLKGATCITPAYTKGKDTALIKPDGSRDDANREPALDIFEEHGFVFEVPHGRYQEVDDMPYEYMILPVYIPATCIPEELKSKIAGQDEKSVTLAVIEYLDEIMLGNVNIQEKQLRSHSLDSAELGNLAWDKSSAIAVMTEDGDLLVQTHFWIKYEELAMRRLNSDLKFEETTLIVDEGWSARVDVSRRGFGHKRALEFLAANAWHFFDEFSRGDYSNVNLLVSLINKIEPAKMVNANDIVYDPVLGVFKSVKDGEAELAGFDENLEKFLASLNTVQQLVQLLYFLSVPVYDNEEEAEAVPNETLQDAVATLYYKLYRRFDRLAGEKFNDPAVFEPIRMEIGRFADLLNIAIRVENAMAVNGTEPVVLFSYLVSKGVKLSSNEKIKIRRVYELYKDEEGSWLYDISQLAEILSQDNYLAAMKYLKTGEARRVLPHDKPLEVFDGTGRIGTLGLALRLSSDVNTKETEYSGKYCVRTRRLKAQKGQQGAVATALVEDMFNDSVITASELAIKTDKGQEVSIVELIAQDRLQFQSGGSVLEAKQDFGEIPPAKCVYPVDILLDSKIIGKVYVIDCHEFSRQVMQKVGRVDNVPRPFIVKDDGEEVVFNLLTDVTPGGVWIGDGIMELLVDSEKYSKQTAWQLAGVEILPESGIATLERLVNAVETELYDKYPELERIVISIQESLNMGVSATIIMCGLSKDEIEFLKDVIMKEELVKEILGDAEEELKRLEEFLQQIEDKRLAGRRMPFDYHKAQITAKLLLPLGGGIHFMGRYIHKLPKVKEAGAVFYTPTSCSTNGASYFDLMLNTLAGLGILGVAQVGTTDHMYTGDGKKGTWGHYFPKSTGAAKGVKQHFDIRVLFTALRTAAGLKAGEDDVVGGSAFYFLTKLPVAVNKDVLIRFLARVATQNPEILMMFGLADKENGKYTWKKTIGGQRTGSIVYEDLIKQVMPDVFSAVVAYDNEMSYSFKMNEMQNARFLALKRQRDKLARSIIDPQGPVGGTSSQIPGNDRVTFDLVGNKVTAGDVNTTPTPEDVLPKVSRITGIVSKKIVNPDKDNPLYQKKARAALRLFADRLALLVKYFSVAMENVIARIVDRTKKISNKPVYLIRGDGILFNAQLVDTVEAQRLEDQSLYRTINIESASIGIAKTLKELSEKRPDAEVVIYSSKFTAFQMQEIMEAIDAGGHTNIKAVYGNARDAYDSVQDKESKSIVVADLERVEGLDIPQIIVAQKGEGEYRLSHMPFFNLIAIMNEYVISDTPNVEEILILYRMWLNMPENGYTKQEINVMQAEFEQALANSLPLPLPRLPEVESLLKRLDQEDMANIGTYA